MNAAITASATGGNWSATTAWTGGVVPGAGDDAIFHAASGSVTADTNAAACRSCDFSGLGVSSFAATFTIAAAVTWSIGTSTVNGTLAVTFVAGMTLTLGSATTSVLAFISTSGTQVQITSAGKTLPLVQFTGSGGSWLLADGFSTGATSAVTLTAGTLNTGGQTCSWGGLSLTGSTARTLTLAGTSLTLAGTGTVLNVGAATNLTITANTATITAPASSITISTGTSITWSGTTFICSGGGVVNWLSAGTVTNLTRTGTASRTDSIVFSAAFTISGTLTLNSNSSINRLLVQTSAVGTSRTLTVGTLVASNVIDFMDITGAGAATWTTGASGATFFGNCQGNSGITFTTPATQTWSGNTTGNWSTAGNWTSRVPLPQDNVLISGLSSGTVTADMPRLGASIDFTGSTGGTLSLTLNISTFGNVTSAVGVSSSMTGVDSWTLAGRGNQTVTSHGTTVPPGPCTVQAVGGTYQLLDGFATTSTRTLTLLSGTFDMNSQSVTTNGFTSSGSAAAMLMLSGTFSCSGTGTLWNVTNASLTISQTTGTIVLSDTSSSTKTFAGGGDTYNNLSIAGGGTGTVTLTGANTFNVLSIGAPKTVIFPSATTTTAREIVFTGPFSAVNAITLNSSTGGTQATISTNATMAGDYITVKDIKSVNPAFAGIHGTLQTNNTNWSAVNYLPPTPLIVNQALARAANY